VRLVLSVVQIASLVREGEASAREVVEEALARIAASELNAFVDVDEEAALAAADAVDPSARLAGVPVAIKADTPVAGLVCDHGSAALAGRRADHDAHLVRRLEQAGCVVVGTTRMAEFKLLPTTEPVHGGPVRNPWDPDRTAGGSSGGSAAAVAAGLVPLAHGNDGGNSLRAPAACCGVVGLKPSRGRISRGPAAGDSFVGVEGAFTRTVLDTAAALDVLAGYEVGDPTWASRPDEPYLLTTRRDPGPLRIAVHTANAAGSEPDPEHIRALEDTAAVLGDLGHEVFEVDLPAAPPDAVDRFNAVVAAECAAEIRATGADLGRCEPLTRAVAQRAQELSAVDYLVAQADLKRMARQVIGLFAGWDLLMTPMLAQRPLAHGVLHGSLGDPLEALTRAGAFAPYGALFSLTGQPAVSVPTGLGPDGLPTAIQLVGRPLAEDVLLQVAYGIEALAPFPVFGEAGAAP
jgi:amidase